MDVHSPEQRSRNMKAIKSKGTKIEGLLMKALWERGYRYRKDNSTIFGKPDITFRTFRIAIFCDGEFFHGKDWETVREKIGNNREFWIKKIEGNIRRDQLVNERLTSEGWIVLRFWGNEIKKDIGSCINKVENAISARRDQTARRLKSPVQRDN